MKQLSRSVVYVDTNPKHERIAVLKGNNLLKDLDDADTNVFQKSLIDRYEHRPLELQSMCLLPHLLPNTSQKMQTLTLTMTCSPHWC